MCVCVSEIRRGGCSVEWRGVEWRGVEWSVPLTRPFSFPFAYVRGKVDFLGALE